MHLCIAPEKEIGIVTLSPKAKRSFPSLGGTSGGQTHCTLTGLPGVTFSLAGGKRKTWVLIQTQHTGLDGKTPHGL